MMSSIEIIGGKETFKKFMGVCLETDMIPDETFEENGAYVLCFREVKWGAIDDEFTEQMSGLLDELDGEDEEPYKMLRIGEELTDLEERANDCGSDAYDAEFYIVREFSRKGNHFSR